MIKIMGNCIIVRKEPLNLGLVSVRTIRRTDIQAGPRIKGFLRFWALAVPNNQKATLRREHLITSALLTGANGYKTELVDTLGRLRHLYGTMKSCGQYMVIKNNGRKGTLRIGYRVSPRSK